jgi:hypothetical protein
MFTLPVRRRRLLRTGAMVCAATAALVVPFGQPAGADTTPSSNYSTPGLTVDRSGAHVTVFYQGTSSLDLIVKDIFSGAYTSLGEAPVAGRSGLTIQNSQWVFTSATHAAVYRQQPTPAASWSGWQSLGGYLFGAPTASCVRSGPPVVWVRGVNNNLYRRVMAAGHGWQRLGGPISSDPVAIPTVMGACPAVDDLFMLGPNNRSLYEYSGGKFSTISGLTDYPPAAVRFPDGRTWLFIHGRGTNALYYRTRAAGSAAWSNWVRLGGLVTGIPVAAVVRGQAIVVAQGTNLNLYRGQFQSGRWVWTVIP